jgi:hypothetical protein
MPEVDEGDLTGNVVGDGSGEASYLNWQLASQNVEDNYSIINWQIGWYFVDLSCRGLRKGYANINGSYVYYDFSAGDHIHAFNSGHDHRPSLQIASGSVQLFHGETGGCTFGTAVTMTGFNNQTSSGSASYDLPTIVRTSNAPTAPVVTDADQTALTVTFTDGVGGGAIDNRQLRYGIDPDGVGATVIPSSGFNTITGLNPATTYYIWARTHNAAGYSDWSARTTTRTIAGARVNDGGVWKEAIPYVRDGGVWKLARPWAKILGEWKETI